MRPPEQLNVIDACNGFTIETPTKHYVKVFEDGKLVRWDRKMVLNGDTLWRPAQVLKGKDPLGTLVDYNERSFFQNNNDVTIARYKVKGYRYLVVCWFDNSDGHRIA